MALVPCSACKRRVVGKLIAVYVARFAGQQRIAHRTKLCHSCATEYAETVKAARPIYGEGGSDEWPDGCGVCGAGTADDLDPIYLTIFEPKQDARNLTIPTCSTCTMNLVPMLTAGAEPLAERQLGNGAVGSSSRASGEGAPSPLAWA